MPELPEVETVVRDLRSRLLNRSIQKVWKGPLSLRRGWNPKWDQEVLQRSIHVIVRRGKWIQMILDSNAVLILHLGMTGQLTVQSSKQDHEDHVHFSLSLDDGSEELRFRDIRRFGSVQFFDSIAHWEASLTEPLGPEPFDLDLSIWKEELQKSSRPIKAILLDQSIVAGIGNIYADETLFAAKLHPLYPGNQITPSHAKRLRLAIISILQKAIDSRGSTIRNYIGGSGLQGGYQSRLAVYGQKGEPCLNCKTAIEVIRVAGRSSFHCPQCQVLPEVKTLQKPSTKRSVSQITKLKGELS